MKSMRQSCKCGQEPLCKSISKIIHFAAATHFRLPLSIKDVSGEDDGWLRCRAWPLLFNLSSTPRRPPPSTLSSFHIPLHRFPYSSSSPQPSSATACIKEKGGPHCCSWPGGSSAFSLRSEREKLWPTKWFPEERVSFGLCQTNLNYFVKNDYFKTLSATGNRVQRNWCLKSL